MKITKEICDILIGANTRNRAVSKQRVDAIARSIISGWFEPNNGQTIVVNKSWTWLLDGQHRLYAMRKAGVYGFDIPIVEVDDDRAEQVFNTIDIVRGSRSNAQIIGLTTSIPNFHQITAVIAAMLEIAKNNTSPSPSEIVEYYNKYESALVKMKVYTKCVVGGIRPKANVWAGVLNAILLSGNEDGIVSRFENILSNKCSCVCDNILLNLIVSSRRCKAKATRCEEFYKITKGLLNRDLKIIKILNGEDTSALKFKNF